MCSIFLGQTQSQLGVQFSKAQAIPYKAQEGKQIVCHLLFDFFRGKCVRVCVCVCVCVFIGTSPLCFAQLHRKEAVLHLGNCSAIKVHEFVNGANGQAQLARFRLEHNLVACHGLQSQRVLEQC